MRAHLESVRQVLPGGRRRRHRRVDAGREDEAVPPVVVGAAPVLRQVERIDGPAEEELADVVLGLRQRVAGPVVAPARRPLRERHQQRRGRSTSPADGYWLLLAYSGIGPAAVVGAGGHARRHVLVDRHQQPVAPQVRSSRRSPCRARRPAARPRGWPGANRRSAGRAASWSGCTASPRAPAPAGWPGTPARPPGRATARCCCWRSCARSVVLPADSSALASARSGTRSKYSPALPRTTRSRDVERRPREADARRHVVACRCRWSRATAGRSAARGSASAAASRSTRPGRRGRRWCCPAAPRSRRRSGVKPGVVVGAGQEVGQRRERVRAPHRAREGDGVVVVDEVDAGAQRVRAALLGDGVDDLEHLVEPALRTRREACRTRPRRRCSRPGRPGRSAAPAGRCR